MQTNQPQTMQLEQDNTDNQPCCRLSATGLQHPPTITGLPPLKPPNQRLRLRRHRHNAMHKHGHIPLTHIHTQRPHLRRGMPRAPWKNPSQQVITQNMTLVDATPPRLLPLCLLHGPRAGDRQFLLVLDQGVADDLEHLDGVGPVLEIGPRHARHDPVEDMGAFLRHRAGGYCQCETGLRGIARIVRVRPAGHRVEVVAYPFDGSCAVPVCGVHEKIVAPGVDDVGSTA